MDIAYGRIMPTVPADRRLFIKPRLPDYLLKLSFDSVVSGDQEYGYPLLPALTGGILKTFAASELFRIWRIASFRCDAEFGRHREHSRHRSKAGIFASEWSRTLQVALLED
jgi:hypothetical protein